MTDAAQDDEFYRALATLPSVYFHPVASARGLRSSWRPVMGERLARRYARNQLFLGLAIQLYFWGFVGGLLLVVFGSFAVGVDSAGPIGVTLGLAAIFAGLVLFYVGYGARRGATTELLELVRQVNPRCTRGQLNDFLVYEPDKLLALAKANPEVFPPRD